MRKRIITGILLFSALISSNWAYSQPDEASAHPTAPIPLEVVLGSDGWSSQIILDRKFSSESKFGFFALSYLKADYDNNEASRESLNLTLAKYDILSKVSVVAGTAFNSHWGFRPYSGGQFTHATRYFTGILISGLYLTETHNYEALAMLEYRPQIKENWSLFMRAQGLYNQNTETGNHDRSFLYGRLGLSYKSITLGAALNYDWYGPIKMEEHSLGIFLSTNLR